MAGGVTEAIETIGTGQGTGQGIANAESLLTATMPGMDAGTAAGRAGIVFVIMSGGTVTRDMAMTFATADIETLTTLAIGGDDLGKRAAVAGL